MLTPSPGLLIRPRQLLRSTVALLHKSCPWPPIPLVSREHLRDMYVKNLLVSLCARGRHWAANVRTPHLFCASLPFLAFTRSCPLDIPAALQHTQNVSPVIRAAAGSAPALLPARASAGPHSHPLLPWLFLAQNPHQTSVAACPHCSGARVLRPASTPPAVFYPLPPADVRLSPPPSIYYAIRARATVRDRSFPPWHFSHVLQLPFRSSLPSSCLLNSLPPLSMFNTSALSSKCRSFPSSHRLWFT